MIKIIELDKDKEWIENQSIQINVKGLKEGKTKINIEINAATFDEEAIKKTHTIEVEVKSNGTSTNYSYLIVILAVLVVVAIIFVFKLKKK